MSDVELYTYFRSSAAYRVRIVLGLKEVDWSPKFVHLLHGEQQGEDYASVNPQQLVPALSIDGAVVTQSIAICELLEEIYPEPPLLPADALERAYVRAIVNAVACDIHPLNNLRVLSYLGDELEQSKEVRRKWYAHWIDTGFTALEKLVVNSGRSAAYCLGDRVTLADAFLVPQVVNAIRFHCPLDAFPTITGIYERCADLPAFRNAAPDKQDDAE